MVVHLTKDNQLRHQKEPNTWWLSNMEIQILCDFLLQNKSANQFVQVIGPSMTKRMQLLYDKKIHLDGTENPTNAQQDHFNMELQHFFKYIISCRDLFNKKFLVFISNVPLHWTVIIVVNPFLVFDRYVFGDKYIHKHDDNFAGWCVINSLCGGPTAVPHEYLTGTLVNPSHPELGVHLFLNYCTSFLKGEYSKTTYSDCSKFTITHESGTEIKRCPKFHVRYNEPFGH